MVELPCFATTPQGAVQAIYIFRSMLVLLLPPAFVCATVQPGISYVRSSACDIFAYEYLDETSNTLLQALIAVATLLCLYGSPDTILSAGTGTWTITASCGPLCTMVVLIIASAYATIKTTITIALFFRGTFLSADHPEECREGVEEACHTVGLVGLVSVLLAPVAYVAFVTQAAKKERRQPSLPLV